MKPFSPASLSISPEELQALNDYISARFGMHFPEHKQEILASRLSRRLEQLKLKSFMDYYLVLQFNPDGEIPHLTKAITNNETYFFRETHQFNALFEHALPEILAEGALPGELRILCAGCSSGEEPYTLSFFVKDNMFRMWQTQVTIDAFDLEPERVRQAQSGQYGSSSMRHVEQEQMQKYFTSLGSDRYEVRSFYRGSVKVTQGNIMDPATFVKPISYDVIFCRNVFIYFSEPALRKAIGHFARALRLGGLLFLGHSESILGMSSLFQAVRVGNCIAYRRVTG